jgi:hypothetical protein
MLSVELGGFSIRTGEIVEITIESARYYNLIRYNQILRRVRFPLCSEEVTFCKTKSLFSSKEFYNSLFAD